MTLGQKTWEDILTKKNVQFANEIFINKFNVFTDEYSIQKYLKK